MPHQQFDLRKARPAVPGSTRAARGFAWLRIAFLTFVVLAVVATFALLPFVRATMSLYAHAQAGRADLQAAQTSAEQLDATAALGHVDDAEREFGDARDELYKIEPFQGVPLIGPYITTADDVLASGTVAVSAVREALVAMQDVLGVLQQGENLSGSVTGKIPDPGTLFRNITPDQKRALLGALEHDSDKFAQAEQEIGSALAAFDRIDMNALSPKTRTSLADVRQKLVTLKQVFGALGPIARYVPPLLGYPDAKRYLVFFENNTELRPTGGFLGMYGTVEVKDAGLVSVHTDDIYALDGPSEKTVRPAPPAPIQKYIGIDKWYLRDANWSPDFPTSAAVMEKFYRQEAAIAAPDQADLPVDGVIAVTPQLAVDLLKLTGPITVDGTTFSADNFVDQLEFQVEQNFAKEGVSLTQRKGIVGDLLNAMIGKMTSMPVSQLLTAVGVVHKELQESQVLLYMKDPELQQLVLQNDWGGKLRSTDGDYLSVIDANLASLKSDPAVHRTISYGISKQAQGWVADVAITYDHQGTFDWKTTRYRTYTRIYVPLGSKLLEVKGAMENDKLKDPAGHPGKADVGQEVGKTWFGAFISIEPKHRGTLEFRYVLPDSIAKTIENGHYTLLVEKEPGTIANGLTLNLDFGKNLVSATPPENFTEFGDQRYRYDTDLRTDRQFSIDLAH